MKIDVIVLTANVVVVTTYHSIVKSNVAFFKKFVIFIDITVYDETSMIQTQLTEIVEYYFKFWINDDFIVRISKNEWMSIKIKSNVKIEAVKIYSLKLVDRKLVDEVFDKLHEQNRMKYNCQFTLHNYSNFVVWRTMNDLDESKRKKRVIINIRDFNKIIVIDSYSMLLQFDIISIVVDCIYISIFDVIDFFHQWLMRIIDRHKLTIISHKKQKQYNVTVMSFKNSSIYVQRKINVMLRIYKVFARVYVNDVMIFSHTLKKHIVHLHAIFELFDFFDITLSSKKSFFDYFTIALLNQKIDVFDLTTTIDKLKIIMKLNFFYTLKNLKDYFDLIDWFRDFVFWYAQKANVLQRRKILLIRLFFFNKKSIRKIYSQRIVIENFTNEKLKFYRQLQKSFNQTIFLIHFFVNRILFTDIDVFKRRDFEIITYHLKSNVDLTKSKKFDIESILFLNRMLNETKKNYWLIELKMMKLIWIVRRFRHMIEAIKQTTMIFTNHNVNIFIIKQITLFNNNIDKLNFRFVRVFIYLSQFKLNIKYRFDKNHVVSNALSRFFFDNELIKNVRSENKLNLNIYHDNMSNSSCSNQIDVKMYVLHKIIIIMSNDFRQRVFDDYVKKKIWQKFSIMLQVLSQRIEKKKSQKQVVVAVVVVVIEIEKKAEYVFKKLRIDVDFELAFDELIYNINTNVRRLCIFVVVKQEIYNLIYDDVVHADIHRCYNRITNILYISRLTKKIRSYVKHCFNCQFNQIKRHRFYDELMFITSSSQFFHIIIIDFILKLFEKMNVIFIVIDKFFRRVMFILDKFIYDVSEWKALLMKRLLNVDWELSVEIVFDRDSKFLFDLWRVFFQIVNIALFTSTTYHSQIDDSSKKTNQIIKITLRFIIINYSNIDFILMLSTLQIMMNNAFNVVIDLSFNEIIYEFKIFTWRSFWTVI